MHLLSAIGVGLVGAILALGAIPLFRRLLGSPALLDVPVGPLQVHTRPVPRLGGVGVFASLVALLPVLARENTGGLLPTAIFLVGVIFAVGLADDRFGLPAPLRLVVQLLVGAVAGLLGFAPPALPVWLGVPATALWLAACANSLNWLDGADGLAGGVAAIASAVLAAAFHAAGLWAWRDLNAAVCGALVTFLFYNLSNGRQKVFLGDCGSMSCGVLLGLSVLVLGRHAPISGLKLAPTLILAVPLTELVATVVRRAATRRPLLVGDRGHTYDVLMRAGVRLRDVLLLHWAATLALGLVALRSMEV